MLCQTIMSDLFYICCLERDIDDFPKLDKAPTKDTNSTAKNALFTPMSRRDDNTNI